jgi:hypothetical protein
VDDYKVTSSDSVRLIIVFPSSAATGRQRVGSQVAAT